MPSYHWAKIWIDVLDDHKLGPLDDHLWRRFFEFVLLAKEADQEGALPDVRAMAWRLRTTEAELQSDLEALADVCDGGLLYCDEGVWYVTNFTKRQETPMDAAERQRRKRERDRKLELDDTPVSPDCHEDVTTRNIEGEGEKRKSREEGEKRKSREEGEGDAPAPANTSPKGYDAYHPPPAVKVYCDLTGLTVRPIVADAIHEKVGTDPKALDKWKRTISAWLLRPYQKDNLQGMFDWYDKGVQTTGPPGGNGKGDANAPPKDPIIVKGIHRTPEWLGGDPDG